MTTSPPMERLWIAAAGRRRREGQALPTSILGGPGPLERLPLLGPEDRPNADIHDRSFGSDPLDVDPRA